MYFVDRKKIREITDYLTHMMTLFKEKHSWENSLDALALERMTQNIVEGIIDVGNHLIDGFIMRDPGSYEDIIDILIDERVIPAKDEEGLKTLVRLRKTLVQNYFNIDHQELYSAIKENQERLNAFPEKVMTYLEKELGPVSAFSPEQQPE